MTFSKIVYWNIVCSNIYHTGMVKVARLCVEQISIIHSTYLCIAQYLQQFPPGPHKTWQPVLGEEWSDSGGGKRVPALSVELRHLETFTLALKKNGGDPTVTSLLAVHNPPPPNTCARKGQRLHHTCSHKQTSSANWKHTLKGLWDVC